MQGTYSIPISEYRPELGMSLAEYAAIHLRVPISGNPELDTLIAKATNRPATVPDSASCRPIPAQIPSVKQQRR